MKLPLYEKKPAISCGDCKHFRLHYIWDGYRYVDLSYGRCVFPRLKARSADQRCPNWAACDEPRTPAAE